MLWDAGSCATPINDLDTVPLSAAAPNPLMTSGLRLELTDELLKSLIKSNFFDITPTHLYSGYPFHSQALFRHVTHQNQNIRGVHARSAALHEPPASSFHAPPLSTPKSDRWICCMHGRVFPRALRKPHICKQQCRSGIPLPKQTFTPTARWALIGEEAFARMAARRTLVR